MVNTIYISNKSIHTIKNVSKIDIGNIHNIATVAAEARS